MFVGGEPDKARPTPHATLPLLRSQTTHTKKKQEKIYRARFTLLVRTRGSHLNLLQGRRRGRESEYGRGRLRECTPRRQERALKANGSHPSQTNVVAQKWSGPTSKSFHPGSEVYCNQALRIAPSSGRRDIPGLKKSVRI
jgi:hypothetical protein